MCESNIYIVKTDGDGEEEGEELFLEAVDKIQPEGENVWRVTSIFGEQKVINGRILSMELVDHRILFEVSSPA